MAHPTSPAIWPTGSKDKGMDHVRGAPYHPQTQGKIERWHQTLKNRILLENYYLPGDLERRSAPSSITTTTGATTRAWQPHPGRRLLRQGAPLAQCANTLNPGAPDSGCYRAAARGSIAWVTFQ
jgi:hypothetical protein